MPSPHLTSIVLAAGMGSRMHSEKPKVIHVAAGRPLIRIVLDELSGAGVNQHRVVVGYKQDLVKEVLSGFSGIEFFTQADQLGTGHAVSQARPQDLKGVVLICNGDMPLVTSKDYFAALNFFESEKADLVVLGGKVKNPKGLGRLVIGKSGELEKIVEEKDASAHERKIHIVNSGVYVIKAELLGATISKIKNRNAQNEFYLTDIIKISKEMGKTVKVFQSPSPTICLGVNTQLELSRTAKILYFRKAKSLMENGVRILDPRGTFIDHDVQVDSGAEIGPGVFLKGKTHIGANAVIEPHCQIDGAAIERDVHIKWGSVIEKSKIKNGAIVGPYARIRPESEVGEKAHIGNFVELKKTVMGPGAKANHLTYLGDASIGAGTNIGCGTITCNYAVDKKKYKTVIGDDCFVGSDVQFVAPVTIGKEVVIASGSTITKNVPDHGLAFGRAKQVIKENYYKKKD